MKAKLALFMIGTVFIAGCFHTGGVGGGSTITAPSAVGAATPTAGAVGDNIQFTSAGSDTGGDNAAAFSWEFCDGTTGTGSSASHAYALPGDYAVRLKVKNEKGEATNEANLVYVSVAPAALDFSSVTEENAPPSAEISVDRSVIQKGSTVTANASGSYGWAANPNFDAALGVTPDNLPVARAASRITAVEWDWGDGSAKESGNMTSALSKSHTYANAGMYTMKLTVTAANGLSGTTAQCIVVLGSAPSVGGYKYKDLFVTATISGPQSFDPAFDYETAGGQVIEQVYETLFGTERGNTAKVTADLAAEVPTKENGGINDDATVYTIKIRQGVKFHDGSALNAAAVKFSLDRAVLMNDPASGAVVFTPILKGAEDYRRDGRIAGSTKAANSADARAEWLALEAVKVVDEYTIRITMEAPNAAFFQRLAFYGSAIVSPTAIKACHQERQALWGACQTADGLPPPGITRDPWADTNAVGTGPFKLRKWLPGDRVIMDRNDNYWGPKPALKTVIIQYVDDLNTRILMFKNGDADEIYIPSSDLDRVKPTIESIARFTPADTLIIDAFFFNYDIENPNECVTVAGGAKDCKFFQDIHVRKAFAHAFNYQSFFADIWKGRAKDLAGVIPRGMPGYDPNLQPYATNVDLAKSELAQSKGKDGFTTSCYYNSGNNVRKGACELLKQNVEALNPGKITINVVAIPFNQLLDDAQNQKIPFWILGWSPDYIATDDYIFPFLHSTGNYPSNQNFKDAEIDAKIDAALKELDPVKQADMFRDINRLAVERYVDIWLDQRTQTHVERTYVQGYYYSPLHSGSPNIGDYSTISKA